MQKNGFEVIVCKGLLIYVINWSRNFENCWNINTTETCLKLKLLILMRFENFLMIEYYTERMTKDWNQERYTVRNYHNLFYFSLLSSKILALQLHRCKSKANQVPSKMNTQLMAEKKPKNYATKKTYFQFMAEKSNNSTMTKKHCLLLMAEKNYSMQKQTELWLIADSSAKEWMLQRIFRYTQKTQLDRLCML